MAAVLLASLLLPWDQPTPDRFLDGYCTYYSAGTMERVAQYRHMPLDGAIGYVALNRAGDLGRLVWLEYNGAMHGPYRVVDMARRGSHYEERERRGYVAEVSWKQATAWNMQGPVAVRVHFEPPEPEGCI